MNTVRAMVMAAGAGTRLRPMTDQLPKPLIPIANRPVLEYTIENLKRHGITNIILNLHNHPDQIRNYFGDGSRWGVSIEYSFEPNLMGTAGGVRRASQFFHDQTFLVTSGDGLTDINFADLVAFHHRRKSVATMALSKVESKFDYGVTLTKPTGRIHKFIEKPLWGDIFSNQVNTGIYVFEPSVLKAIPVNKVIDFGHDVWPALLAKGKPIFGHLSKSYWCDVGSIAEYHRAQRDFLDKKAGFRPPGREVRRGVWAEEGASIKTGANVVGPCLVGQGSTIESGAQIGPYAVIGHHSTVQSRASVRHSTLWDNVVIGQGAQVEGTVVGHRTVVAKNTHLSGGILVSHAWNDLISK